MTKCSYVQEHRKRIYDQISRNSPQVMHRNSIPRIFVLVPRAGYFRVLLIDCEGVIGEMFLEFVGHQKTRCSSSDTDDSNMSLSMNWASKPSLDIACWRSTRIWHKEVCHRSITERRKIDVKRSKNRDTESKENVQDLTLAIYPTIYHPVNIPPNHDLPNMWTHQVKKTLTPGYKTPLRIRNEPGEARERFMSEPPVPKGSPFWKSGSANLRI